MTEVLIAYLVLGALAALAQGEWRLPALARATLLWPALLPRLLRQDPSPPDPPGFALWEGQIRAALSSLDTAIQKTGVLGDASAGRKLLTDTEAELLVVARRHAELVEVLDAPENDLRTAREASQGAETHRLPALQRRVEHITRLHAAREALETRLEAGLAEVMNLSARLHLSRATDAPVSAVADRIADIARAVEGVEEAEQIADGLRLDEILSPDWTPALQPEIVLDTAPPRPSREAASPADKQSFEEAFAPSDAVQLPATRPPPHRPHPAERPAVTVPVSSPVTDTTRSRWALAGSILALGLGSILYRALVGGDLEQTAALFVGLPAMLAAVVALLPPARSYTGMLLKLMTLMLLLSGILLAEGMICVMLAAPLFYMVGISAGVVLDLLRTRAPTTRVLALSPLLLLSMEGVLPQTTLDRADAVSVSRVVAASPEAVVAALSASPRLDAVPMPAYLRAFPHPVRALGAGLEPGDRRIIHFTGGGGRAGDLMLEVGHVAPGEVTFEAIADTSPVAHSLTWKRAEVRWEALAPDRTRVEWTFHYDREVDPWIWFRPTARYAARLAASHLLDCLLLPEVSDVAP